MEASPHPWPTLGVLLMRDGFVTKEELLEILDEQRDTRLQRITGRRLGEILIGRGVVSPIQVARLVAEQYELPFVELEPDDVDLQVAGLMSEAQALHFSALPVNRRADGTLLLAIADPSTVVFSEELRKILGSVPHFAVAGQPAVDAAIASVHSRLALAPEQPAAGDVLALDHSESEAAGDSFTATRTVAHLWPPLGALLIREGLLSDEELETALSQQRLSTTRRLGEILVERGIVPPAAIARLVAEQYELDYVELDELEVDVSLVRLLPEEMARAFRAVPVARHDDGSLAVAIADPTNVFYSDELHTALEAPVTFLVAAADAIETLIAHAYAETPHGEPSVEDAVAEPPTSAGPDAGVLHEFTAEPLLRDVQEPDFDPAAELIGRTVTDAVVPDEPLEPVLELVEEPALDDVDELVADETEAPAPPDADTADEHVAEAEAPATEESPDLSASVRQALADGASAIHVSHAAGCVVVRARFENGLHALGTYADDRLRELIDEFGDDPSLDVSVLPTTRGSKITLLRRPQPAAPRSLAELGLDEERSEDLRTSLSRPGLTVVCGPPQSGVTTTLYALLGALATSERVAVTLEQRVELTLDDVDQLEIGPATGSTVAGGLGLLGETDSDVVLVGALRDSEAAKAALRLALDGRHVLIGTSAPTATAAVVALRDLGVDAELLASALRCVVSQRLVRVLCTDCRKTYYASPDDLTALGLEGSGNRLLARARGCESCAGSGFVGSRAVFEVLHVTDDLRALAADASEQALHEAAVEAGMTTLDDEAVRLCLDGLTTPAELERAFSSGI